MQYTLILLVTVNMQYLSTHIQHFEFHFQSTACPGLPHLIEDSIYSGFFLNSEVNRPSLQYQEEIDVCKRVQLRAKGLT